MAFRVVPHRELEAFARERYQRWRSTLPKPKVINTNALLAFTSARPRIVVFGGVQYRSPSLSFEDGSRLWIACSALESATTPQHMVRAHLTIARLLRRILAPRNLIRRLLYRWRRNPFLSMESMVATYGIAMELMHVEDESAVAPSTGATTIDLMDGVMAFRREYGAYPVTWAEYRFGLGHLSRVAAREQLRAAVAARMVNANKDQWKQFIRDESAAAGW